MIDIIGESLHTIERNTALAPAAAFLAGAATSIGPCTAPRMIAIAIASTHTRGRSIGLASTVFLAGLIGAYTLLGLSAAAFAHAVAAVSLTYGLMTVGLILSGVSLLFRRSVHADHTCATGVSLSLPANFALGVSFACVLSPCCIPLYLTIAAIGSLCGPVRDITLLASFATGHALPVIATAIIGGSAARFFQRPDLSESLRIMSGSLALVLGIFYAALI